VHIGMEVIAVRGVIEDARGVVAVRDPIRVAVAVAIPVCVPGLSGVAGAGSGTRVRRRGRVSQAGIRRGGGVGRTGIRPTRVVGFQLGRVALGLSRLRIRDGVAGVPLGRVALSRIRISLSRMGFMTPPRG